jgi:hypothetical protein
MLLEQNDEWSLNRRYMPLEDLCNCSASGWTLATTRNASGGIAAGRDRVVLAGSRS